MHRCSVGGDLVYLICLHKSVWGACTVGGSELQSEGVVLAPDRLGAFIFIWLAVVGCVLQTGTATLRPSAPSSLPQTLQPLRQF